MAHPRAEDFDLQKFFLLPPAPGDTTHTKTVVIDPAVTFEEFSGLNTPTSAPGSRIVIVQIKDFWGDDCGTFLVGTAQERLTNIVRLGSALPDTDWQPIAASPTFYLASGQIVDEHSEFATGAAWTAIPVGVIVSCTQEFRVVYSDPCGDLRYMPIDPWTITHRKLSASQWQVE